MFRILKLIVLFVYCLFVYNENVSGGWNKTKYEEEEQYSIQKKRRRKTYNKSI